MNDTPKLPEMVELANFLGEQIAKLNAVMARIANPAPYILAPMASDVPLEDACPRCACNPCKCDYANGAPDDSYLDTHPDNDPPDDPRDARAEALTDEIRDEGMPYNHEGWPGDGSGVDDLADLMARGDEGCCDGPGN